MDAKAKPSLSYLTGPEQRMLMELCYLDSVGEAEALRRSIRLAFFARMVPDEVLLHSLGPSQPVEHDPDGWRPTGEVRVSLRGELVAEREHFDGSMRWVAATPSEIEAYFERADRRR